LFTHGQIWNLSWTRLKWAQSRPHWTKPQSHSNHNAIDGFSFSVQNEPLLLTLGNNAYAYAKPKSWQVGTYV
jgi:hypothetical protein